MSMDRLGRALVRAATLLILCSAAHAGTVSSLRVMLHPYAAGWGELPDAQRAHLEELAGSSLTLVGSTRTGALELALPASVDDADAAKMIKKLRVDRSVLWAEAVASPLTKRVAPQLTDADVQGQRLMVRLKPGAEPVGPGFLNRIAKRIEMPVTFERQIAHISVLRVAMPQSAERLVEMARLIEAEPDVQYADPVRTARPAAVPNDPYYASQWALHGLTAGINAETAWTLQPSAAGVTVAVVDTGILPHPDLAGRVLPGYDFIADAERARDGNARDPDPRDEGDWSNGECGPYSEASFFHGLFVAGIIAANTNNGIGIAGIAANANILPVRVLGMCGGTFEDIMAGVLWASGVRIDGVPPNRNPARIINLSLGGFGACDQSLQEAIDDAIAHGAVVVAAAGNSTQDVSDFTPANCSGVVTVGAHGVRGNITTYSNFGRRIDLTAPGGDLPANDLVVSLHYDGATVPEAPSYAFARGTSFAAPMVSGAAALLLARDGMFTSGRVLDLVTGTSRAFPAGSQCVVPNLCGAGMLDAGAAVGSAIPGGPAPPNAVRVVEYYRADLDHYFITGDPAEVAWLDAHPAGIFKRTGLYFYAYLNGNLAPPGSRPVCRFYASAAVFIDSHWYSASAEECFAVLSKWPGIWNLETGTAFYIRVPDAKGNCPAGTLPVYRFFNNRKDANHRYSVDLSVRRAMLNRQWAAEGTGEPGVAFCSAI
jgi:serine protease